ncbi:shikimate dehydrogenase [Polymorphobacter megasporae]|uniref:shikimate dehydrogenase n=1 Tax=Glacieibacterium megasporae TaxID=2835787 RepID=UPI001C1E73E8|nr:shikimate dehydrogenase [Polymorphobacter megasporae]UAJ10124.1 shikimate dehydrogenase [Polymorphobacter megasporae]
MPAAIRTALIGRGIRESSSPALHETEGAALGLDYRYRLIDLDDNGGTEALPMWLDRLQRDGYSGANITYPIKQAVIPLLDRLSPEAEAIGAVNTVKFASDGAREGHNTDWWGFAENLRRTLGNNPLGHVALIGAGGAGAAAAYALAKLGASQLTIFDNDAQKASALVVLMAPSGIRVETLPLTLLAETLAVADGLVQATPIGMLKYPGMPFDPAYLHAGLWVAEIIYVPVDTELVRRARALGCSTVTGVGMVVLQAAEAFRIFTGAEPDIERMMRSFQSLVGDRTTPTGQAPGLPIRQVSPI